MSISWLRNNVLYSRCCSEKDRHSVGSEGVSDFTLRFSFASKPDRKIHVDSR